MTTDVLSLNFLQKNESQINPIKNCLGVGNHIRIAGDDATDKTDSFKSQLLNCLGASLNSQSSFDVTSKTDFIEAQFQSYIKIPKNTESASTTNTQSKVDGGWRGCMPTDDPGTRTISDDFQMWKAWNLYSEVVPTEAERINPSEFLSIVNGVTAEELANAEQKVTPKQEEGLRSFYKGQTGSSSLAGKDVERAIELYNRMFAAGLIEHNPVVDINIGVGHTVAEFGANGEIELYTIRHKGPLWEYENAMYYAQFIEGLPTPLLQSYEIDGEISEDYLRKFLESISRNIEVDNNFPNVS